jgi:formyltetrahydrofolate-dependent phosphoribosylglycinamide formyltransferase
LRAVARLGVLFSGSGRTLENLARSAVEGTLPADVVVAISSHAGAGGLERAKRAGVPARVVDYREHSHEELNRRIYEILEDAGVEWIALGGFLRHVEIPPRFAWRILNIHPALLPGFGGKGYYGDRVHRAVLESGSKFSGCTVHFVTAEYDSGPIIVQRVVPVHDGDTVQSLAARVFHEECIAYPEALRLCIQGRVKVEGKRALLVQQD